MHWYDQYDVGLKGNWSATGFRRFELENRSIFRVGLLTWVCPDAPAVAGSAERSRCPDPIPAGRALLFLGSIERMDTAYINGTEVGASAWVENPRMYFIPDGVLKPGKNVIAIRVLKTKAEGGFLGKPEELRLVLGDKTAFRWQANGRDS